MAYKPVVKKCWSNTPKAKNQQRCRHCTGLFKKAYEYGVECDADVCVVLQIRKNGQIYTYNSDCSGHWPPPQQELVSYYQPWSGLALTLLGPALSKASKKDPGGLFQWSLQRNAIYPKGTPSLEAGLKIDGLFGFVTSQKHTFVSIKEHHLQGYLSKSVRQFI